MNFSNCAEAKNRSVETRKAGRLPLQLRALQFKPTVSVTPTRTPLSVLFAPNGDFNFKYAPGAKLIGHFARVYFSLGWVSHFRVFHLERVTPKTVLICGLAVSQCGLCAVLRLLFGAAHATTTLRLASAEPQQE